MLRIQVKTLDETFTVRVVIEPNVFPIDNGAGVVIRDERVPPIAREAIAYAMNEAATFKEDIFGDPSAEDPDEQPLDWEVKGRYFRTNDGYWLGFKPYGATWSDGDMEFRSDATGYPVDRSGDRLDGTFHDDRPNGILLDIDHRSPPYFGDDKAVDVTP